MTTKTDLVHFETEAAAEAAKAQFLSVYGGAWNPYNGHATILPPTGERETWVVSMTRRTTAD